MLDIKSIISAFEKLVKLSQTDDPESVKLSETLVNPNGDNTGRLVYHPLLKTENLEHIAPDFSNHNYPAWVDGAYTSGSVVSRASKHYVATEDIIAGEEPSVSSKWFENGRLSVFLEERRRDAITTAITTAYNEKKEDHVARETLGDVMLFEGGGSMSDLIIKREGRLVLFSIEILNNDGIEVVLKKLSLQLSDTQSLDIYLWHDSAEAPIATITIVQSAPYSVEWHDIPETKGTLKYKDLSNNLDNGQYYLGYYEDELVGQAVRKRVSLGSMPCGTCSRYNSMAYKKYSQYVKVKAYYVSSPPANNKLWDTNSMVQVADTNWGINLNIITRCNLTNYIISRKEVFADLISNQLKYDLLLEIANNTRSNGLSEPTRLLARGALQETHLGGEGVKKDLTRSRAAASLELSSIENNVCMPKAKSKGIVSKSVSIGGNYNRRF